MKILLVNDDGIGSPGLTALEDGLKEKHEVWVSAPDRERSGASHSLTFAEAVQTKIVAERTLSVKGTPVDCVLAAFEYFLPHPPDLVVSGINIGANKGADILYSGTVGAARQAAILGVPGVAVSLDTFVRPFYFNTVVEFISRNLRSFRSLWDQSENKAHFLNINVPNVESYTGSAVVAPPAKLAYKNTMTSIAAPRGDMYHFYEGEGRIGVAEEGATDIDQLSKGNIVLTPVKVYPEMYDEGEQYASHKFENG
jgi:5'-nucleotidase